MGISNLKEAVMDSYNDFRITQMQLQMDEQKRAMEDAGIRTSSSSSSSATGCLAAVLVVILIPVILIITTAMSMSARTEKLKADAAAESEAAEEAALAAAECHVSDLSELTDDMRDELIANATDTFTYSLINGEQINFVECEEICLLTPKTIDGSTEVYNYVYIILHVNTTNDLGETYEETFDYYWYVRYYNVTLNEDGSNEIYDIVGVQTPSKWYNPSNHWGNFHVVGGFDTAQSLYDNDIRPMGQDYNIESETVAAPEITEDITE